MHMTHIHIFVYFSHIFRKVLDNKQVFCFRRGTSVNEVFMCLCDNATCGSVFDCKAAGLTEDI